MAMAFALLLALLAVAITVAAGGGAGRTICDTANCGKGSCSEAPGPIPLVTTSYNCTCDPGWSQPRLRNDFPPLPSAPCVIPDCTFSRACFNLNLTAPRGIPVTDPCEAVNCGPGECNKGDGFSYRCQCPPGFRNLLNDTSMPCIGATCTFGADCAKLGLTDPLGSPAPAPVETVLLY